MTGDPGVDCRSHSVGMSFLAVGLVAVGDDDVEDILLFRTRQEVVTTARVVAHEAMLK